MEDLPGELGVTANEKEIAIGWGNRLVCSGIARDRSSRRAKRSTARIFLRSGWDEAVLRRVWFSASGGGIGT